MLKNALVGLCTKAKQPCKWNSSGKKPVCHVAFHFLTTHTAMRQYQKIRKGKGIERKGTKTGEIANGYVGTKQM